MQTFTATEAKNNLSAVMDAAQRGPVTIEKNGRPYVTMSAYTSYTPSTAESRAKAKEEMFASARRISDQAKRNGLTDEILQSILNERD